MSFALLEGALSFPCLGCGGEPLGPPNTLCQDCQSKLGLLKGPYCPGCGAVLDGVLAICGKCLNEGRRPWKGAVALFDMNGEGKELLHRYKYQDCPELARAFGHLAAAVLRERGPAFDMIVPTPLHWTRQWSRGFNQAQLLCERVSAELGVPTVGALRRIRRTKQQAKLKRSERLKNLVGAFSASGGDICKNKAILLVDDVMTTGSTLTAAAEALLAAGASEVNIMVLARR